MLPQTGEETRRFQCRAGLDRTFVPALRRRMRARGSRTQASALCSRQTGEETRCSRGRAGLDRTFVPAPQRRMQARGLCTRMRARGSRTQASALCSHKRGRKPVASNVAPGLTVPSFPHPNAGCGPEARAPRQAHYAPDKRGEETRCSRGRTGLDRTFVPAPRRRMRARGLRTLASALCSHKRGRKPAASEVAPGIISGSTRGWDDQCRKRCSMPLHALRTSCESLHSSALSTHSCRVVPRSGSTDCTIVPGLKED